MIRNLGILLAGLVLTVSAGAQAAQYDDIKVALVGVSAAVDTLAQDVDQATDAAGVAQAFTKFGESMAGFKKSILELQAKYPELAAENAEPPAELKDSLAAMQASFGKMGDIMKKANPYVTDPAVQDAIAKMKGGM